MAREHGTYACYVFGPEGSDTSNGCRCPACRDARRDYEKQRKQRAAPPYVSAIPAREHIAWLAGHGVGLKRVAEVSGVSHGALWKLVYGREQRDGTRKPSERIRPETAEKILAVTPADAADGAKVPAMATRIRVEEMVRAGVPKVRIAEWIGQTGPGLQIGSRYVTRRVERRVHEMHTAWLAGEIDVVRRDSWGNERVVEPPAQRRPAPADIAGLLDQIADIMQARETQQWRRRAACRGKPTWVFFPGRHDYAALRAALAICRSCPVRSECLAAHMGEPDGIWGGTSGKQRRAMRRGVAL